MACGKECNLESKVLVEIGKEGSSNVTEFSNKLWTKKW